jgi:hypothetical protein
MRPTAPRELGVVAVAAFVCVAVASAPDAGVSRLVVLIAELLLAGGAAYLLDDSAVALTAVAPVGLWRRRLPRLMAGFAVLCVTWLLILAVLRWQDSLPPVVLATSELAVLCLVSLAGGALLVARGESEPGAMVAPAVALLGMSAFITDQFVKVSIFVPWEGSGGGAVRLAWIALGGLAALVLAVASRDPAQPRLLRSATSRNTTHA